MPNSVRPRTILMRRNQSKEKIKPTEVVKSEESTSEKKTKRKRIKEIKEDIKDNSCCTIC